MERWPTTIRCEGTPGHEHEAVTWLGTWIKRDDGTGGDESSCEPACWVCDATGSSTPPRYPMGYRAAGPTVTVPTPHENTIASPGAAP